MPEQNSPEYQQLEEIIIHYSGLYEDAPLFEPHLTIVGGISGDLATLADRTRGLVQEQDPIEVSLTTVNCSTTKHQCVFLLADPSLELLSLHKTARDTFGTSEEMYIPHLSLIYSEMSIEKRLDICASLNQKSLPESVLLNSVALVKTVGPVPEWDIISKIQL